MSGPDLRLRLALIAWAQGLDLATVSDKASDWERLLVVEHVRKRAFRKSGDRDDGYDLGRGLRAVREKAAASSPPHPDPKSDIREELFGPSEMSDLFEEKYRYLREAPLDEDWFGVRRGWSVKPPKMPHTEIEPGLLKQGWHLVAPAPVLGWMVARPLLGDTKGMARTLGERHLGLRSGFRAADRAGYLLKLSRQSPDLATLTLQRSILWALVELGVVPPTITDAGVPIQTLMVGSHDGNECCVLISGDHLRVWYRTAGRWQREPTALAPLRSEHFSMATLGDDAVTLRGSPTIGFRSPLTVRDLRLHTFSEYPWKFPANAWAGRTRLSQRYVNPTDFLDEHGERWRTGGPAG